MEAQVPYILIEFHELTCGPAGVFPDVNYIILDSKFNYVKTTERKPGSAEEHQICAETALSKKGDKTKGKVGNGKAV